jgi:hypothetical protein
MRCTWRFSCCSSRCPTGVLVFGMPWVLRRCVPVCAVVFSEFRFCGQNHITEGGWVAAAESSKDIVTPEFDGDPLETKQRRPVLLVLYWHNPDGPSNCRTTGARISSLQSHLTAIKRPTCLLSGLSTRECQVHLVIVLHFDHSDDRGLWSLSCR